jgi:dimethylglycine dehydrogenase
VHIETLSAKLSTLVLAGPRSRDVLSQITKANLSNDAFPWLSARWIEVGCAHVLALRVNFVGELGWELHVPTEYLSGIYQAILTAGAAHQLRHFGMYAMDSLRMDKCYRGWKSDLDSGYSPLEAALERFVDLSKPDFVGKAALTAESARGIKRRMVPLTLDSPGTADAPYCTSVFSAGESVGIVTSGVWSHTLNRSVALAYVRADLTEPGTKLAIDVLGERCVATVGREPLFDPDNLRLRQ